MQSVSSHEFASLLRHLTVPDNQVRQQAEQQYNVFLKEQSDIATGGLLNVLSDSSIEVHIRQLAAVLLRRCLIDAEESIYFKISNESKTVLKNELIRLLKQEINSAIRLKVCDIAGELGGSILESKDWPHLPSTCMELCKSPNTSDREVGLALIGLLADSLIGSNEAFLPAAVDILRYNFTANNQDSKAVVLTIKALNYLIQCTRQPSQVESLQSVILPLFQSLGLLIQHTLATNNAHDLQQLSLCVEHLVDIADHSVTFFAYHLESFVPSILDCIEFQSQFQNSSFHFLLIEFLVTISMGANKKLRKLKGPNHEKDFFVRRFLPLCFQMMSNVPDDIQWEKADSVEELNYSSSPCDVGESAFRRVTSSIGVRSTYTIVSNILSTYLPDQSHWQKPYAGLQALACYVEVSVNLPNQAQLELHCKEVIGTLSHFMNHPHPRVKYAALYATSQFLLHHHGHLQPEQVSSLMSQIITNIPASVNPSPRVRRNAMIALIQFIDIAPTSYLKHQHVQLLEIVCNSLREGPTIVQESCVSAIISIAENSHGSSIWMTYYGSIMPIVKELLSYAYRRGLESLWGQALECITILGEAAGKVLFYQDALEIMDLLTKLQNTGQTNEIETSLMKAWVRIARCLGSEFLPYLQFTVNKLFHAMSQDVTVPMKDYPDDQDEDDIDDDESDIQMIETNDGWVSVRTSAVEEQALAIQMVLLLSEKLQEHYYPYVEQTIRLISTLIHSPHEDIRSFSITVLPELVRTTGKALPMNRAPLKELSNYCLGLLIQVLEKESALDIVMTALQSMRQIILYGCMNWNTLIIPSTNDGSSKERNTNAEMTTTNNGNAATSTGNDTNTVNQTPATGATAAATKNAFLSSIEKKRDFVRSLEESQMLSLAKCVKDILRESIQRRAVLRAESQVNRRETAATGHGNEHQAFQDDDGEGGEHAGALDEDDLDEEKHYFQESLELHFNISEVIGALFQTHTIAFYPIYMQEWHDVVMNLSHEYCLPEDRRFALLVLSDVVEYGLGTSNTMVHGNPNNTTNNATPTAVTNTPHSPHTSHTPHSPISPHVPSHAPSQVISVSSQQVLGFFQQFLSLLHGICMQSEDTELKRTACYALGISYELHFPIISASIGDTLHVLRTVITKYTPDTNNNNIPSTPPSSTAAVVRQHLNEEEGQCVDNAVSAVGIITEQSCYHQLPFHQDFLFAQWLSFLPLQYDEEEGEKVIVQCLRMLQELRNFFYEHMNLLTMIISVLIKVIVGEKVPKKLLTTCAYALADLFQISHRMPPGISSSSPIPLSIIPLTREQIQILQIHLSDEQKQQLDHLLQQLHQEYLNAATVASTTSSGVGGGYGAGNVYLPTSPYAMAKHMLASSNNHPHASSPLATAPIYDVLHMPKK